MPAQPDDPLSAAGRHTLGSSYDPPVEPEPGRLSATSPADAESPRANVTIFVPTWHQARERLGALKDETRALYTAVMDHVEAGWPPVRELQALYARNHVRARERDELGCVLSFIDGDVVDLYRGVAADAAALVPEAGASLGDSDPCDLDGEAESFNRYLTLLAMAVGDPAVPDGVREPVRRAARELEGWYAALQVLLRRMDAELDRPVLEGCARDELAA